MRKRLALLGAILALGALVTALTVGSASGGRNAAGPILIGISAAKTGILAPYDLQSGQLFQMRMAQINKAGGVLGRKINVQWIDTKSDKPTAATNAEELISKGAVAIIATCDFDFSFPAINAAKAHKVPGIALCASSPKVATPAIVGDYGGSMGLGSDTEGTAGAEWSTRRRPRTTSRPAGLSSAGRSAARTPSSAARTSTSPRRSRACAARSRAVT
jgi:branched-chain amino acid transport system substrate-binding protein